MPPIVIYGESKRACPSGACTCWAAQYPQLRPSLTPDQFNGSEARSITQLTRNWISEAFGAENDAPNFERAIHLLEQITNLSGGIAPRIQLSPTGHLEVVYYLNFKSVRNKVFPVLPGVCRRGPLDRISEMLLDAHKRGIFKLEMTVSSIPEDLD